MSIEVCRSSEEFIQRAHWAGSATSVIGYAEASADDWLAGFDQLPDIDYKALHEYAKNLKDPQSEVYADFLERVKIALDSGDKLLFAHNWHGDIAMQSLVGVARARLYQPRNPLKPKYVYIPDLLFDFEQPLAQELLVIKAAEIFGKSRVVVDAFMGNAQHRSALHEAGFKETKMQSWPTPDVLKPIVGERYDVQQYTKVIN